MSRRVRLFLGLASVLLLAGLAVGYGLYRDHARTNAVKEFKNKSEPEFARIDEAMNRLYRSVTPRLLGTIDSRRISRAKDNTQRARVIKEEIGFSITSLDYPRSQVNAVGDVLRTADVGALTEIDHPYLAGTSEQMREAQKIGDRNRALIAEIKVFLPKYDALISSIRTQGQLTSDFTIALLRGVDDVARINSVPEGKRALRSMRRKLIRSRNRLRRYKPAPELRQARRVTDRVESGIVDDLNRISRAVDRVDLAGAEAAGASIDRRLSRASGDKRFSFKAIVVNSPLSRQMRRLLKRQTSLAQAYARLGE
jgi:hypothetical protein